MKNRHQFFHQSSAVLLACGLIASLLPGFAAAQDNSTFYVGGDGASDHNPGTASEPFATIQKAANVAQPGDVVKIRDGIYRETVAPANSGKEENPIVFEADAGAEPVISGADLVTTNWRRAKHANLNPASPIYETTINLPPVEYINHDPAATGNGVLMAQQIFVRSKMQQEALWPKVTDPEHPMKDHGYFRMRTTSSRGTNWDWSVEGNNIRLRDDGLPNVPGGLAGAYCTVLAWYVPAGAPILSSSGSEFVIDGNMPNVNSPHMRTRFTSFFTDVENKRYPGRVDDLYYEVRGALGLLTTEGEFYYDESQNKLYQWALGGGMPEDVEYKARNWGFDLTGKSYIHLKRLNFFACDIPTNGESLWPTNAKTWDAIQPTPAHIYTKTDKPTYPTVQAKADAEGFIAGAHPSDRFNPAAVPDPANGILIDYCRFKYLNHQTNMVGMPRNSPLALEMSETGIQQGNSNSNYGNLHRAGIRITGDNCIIRNSVFDIAAGSGVMVTGRNVAIENNYFKDVGYIGNWSGSVAASIVSTGLTIYGNTFWRTGRSHLWNVQRMAEVGFNDWSEYSYLNIDGGGNYTQARFATEENHGALWNEGQYSMYYGRNLLARKERPADTGLLNAFALEGSVWHHNWGHDSRAFAGQHNMSPGIYFDYLTDGAVVHHNVLWNNINADLRAPNGNKSYPLDYESNPLDAVWVYNNTFATPRPGTDGVADGVRPAGNTQMFYAYALCPHTIHNNIYRSGITYSPGGSFTQNSSELNLNNNNADHVWLDHRGPSGAYNSSPANGKPWLIGFGPGQYACGLGLVPKSGSPAIDRGTVVHALRYPNNNTVPATLRGELLTTVREITVQCPLAPRGRGQGEGAESASVISRTVLTDGIGRPLDYVDDPVNGPRPDAGAYEFNGPQVPGAPRYYDHPGHPAHGAWIPGTTLPREFIEGQPWERQWVTTRTS